MSAEELTIEHVARRAGVSVVTVRRWVAGGLVPQYEGGWTRAVASHVRLVARLRRRGHSLEQIRDASQSGRLAFGYLEELLPSSEGRHTLAEAARLTRMSPELIERVFAAMGMSTLSPSSFSEEDVEMLGDMSDILAVGLPLPAIMQLARVYGQAIAQIADAEVRLFHMYVHEPLMRSGISGAEMTREMESMTRELLPFIAPLMTYLHGRLLSYFVEQDVIGHLESDVEEDGGQEGRLLVTIAFADLAGYTRLTEERGDAEAVHAVERFVQAVARTLPTDARVIKSLGDEVMIVAADPLALAEWAVSFAGERDGRGAGGDGVPPPRIGVHYGGALYRDGDYYGREVNQAARVVARASGGEVLVTRALVDAVSGGERLSFDRIGEVSLKGFSEPTELFAATRAED
ncbi:MAG: adenylate/guanylate cyclase domain-containing protein [Solirubrobacteraceae bacterium]